MTKSISTGVALGAAFYIFVLPPLVVRRPPPGRVGLEPRD